MVAYDQPIEIYHSGDWHAVTSDVRDDVSIRRGQGPDTSFAPASMGCTFDNPEQEYSPRNVSSSLFGKIGANTPIRVSYRALLDDFTRTEASGWGSAPDGRAYASASSGTGSTSVGSGVGVHTQATENGFRIQTLADADGNRFRDAEIRARFTPQLSDVTGAEIQPANLILRYTDVLNYYFLRVAITTAEAVTVAIHRLVGGVETVLVAAVTVSGLAFTGQELAVAFGAEDTVLYGKVWDPAATGEPLHAQVIVGDRALRTAGRPGVRTGVAAGNTDTPVTVHYDDLEIRSYRFTGEVERWPQRSNVDDSDVWVPVRAFDLSRRIIAAGERTPKRSALYRWYDPGICARMGRAVPAAHWELSAGSNVEYAAVLTSGTGGAFEVVQGVSVMGTRQVAPWLGSGMALTRGEVTTIVAAPAPVSPTSRLTLDATFSWDSLGQSLGFFVASDNLGTIDTDPVWWASFSGDGVVGYGNEDSSIGDAGNDFSGLHHVRLDMVQNGADVDMFIYVDGVQVGSTFTATSYTLDEYTHVVIDYDDSATAGINSVPVISNIALYVDVTPPSAADAADAAQGHAGETAGNRMLRIADEEGFHLAVTDPDGTEALGPQGLSKPFDSLLEGAEADGGILTNLRPLPAFHYITYADLYDQPVVL